MSSVKWIKIVTDVFDDEKILMIETMPESDTIIVIWFKLLCLAGKQNNSGVFQMGQMPYTDEMFSTIFRRPLNTVRLALKTFEQFGMVEIINDTVTIPNWGKHQNIDQIEAKNEYMKKYMREYREKQKLKIGNSKLCENGLPADEWIAVLDFFNHECAYCGARDGLEQEHIVPVNDGGTYRIGNIVPACRSCNASKGSKSVDGWYTKSNVFDSGRLQRINFYRCKTNISDLHKTNVSSLDKIREEEIRGDKSNEEAQPPESPRHKYGLYKNVLLTDEELHKIQDEFPLDWNGRIERLSEYIESTGKKYKSHLATIRMWARKDSIPVKQKVPNGSAAAAGQLGSAELENIKRLMEG